MAKMTTPRKKKTVRGPRRTGIALTPTKSWYVAKHYVHYEVDSKDWGVAIREYIKENFDKKTIANIEKVADWKVYNNSHWALTAYLLKENKDIVPEEYRLGIIKFVERLSAEGAEIVKDKKAEAKTQKNLHVPTIQDRIRDQAQEACIGIEEWLEGFITNKKTFDARGFNFVSHFAKHKVSQAHARKIQKYYKDELEEAHLMVKMPTPQSIAKIQDPMKKDLALQLREGYSHLTKADAKKYLDALEMLNGACLMIIESAKAVRKPRVKKAPSKEKLVTKLKYNQTDVKYQLTSINPLDLVEAVEIWVFNIKTRKLGKYVAADDCKVMTIKGTTLVGFDEDKSVQKTLRKPEETLKEFKAAGKIKLRKFLEDITTTDTKLTGRINADTILLKAIQ